MALVANYSYQVPLGKGWSGVPRRVASGWELSGIFTAQRGQPFSVMAGVPAPLAAFLGGATGNGTRSPNSVAGRSMSSIILGGVNQYFDPSAFTPPGPRELGNTGRNTLVGPNLVRWDFSLLKNIPFKERYNLQFRAELFNIFNHPNFAGPAATVSNNVLFTASGSQVGSATAIANTLKGNWRQIQLALRLTF